MQTSGAFPLNQTGAPIQSDTKVLTGNNTQIWEYFPVQTLILDCYRVLMPDSGQYDACIPQTKDNSSDINVAIYSMNLPFSLSKLKQVCIVTVHSTCHTSHQVRIPKFVKMT